MEFHMNTVVREKMSLLPAEGVESGPGQGGRHVILREAAKLFSEKGFAESGLREIAEMAGVRASTIYYHFTSKEAIYEEIIRLAVNAIHGSVLAELAALPSGATPRMRVEAAIAGHLRALHANKPFTSTNARSRAKLPEDVDAVIRPVREGYSQFWRMLLDEAQAMGWIQPKLDPRMLRPLILGTLNQTVGWFDNDGGPVETLVRTVTQTFSGIWTDAPLPARHVKAPGSRANPHATKK
jgi:AcrR family transcriptional regulator